VLDTIAIGAVLIGEDLKIVTTNRAADRILAARDGLMATRHGLQVEAITELEELRRLIVGSCSISTDAGTSPGRFLDVSRRNKPPLHLMVSPARGLSMDGNGSVKAIVLITDPSEKARPVSATLQQLYRLTPAECRVAILLADGRAPKQISELLGVSRNTLKSQLSSIFSKTSTSRQSQLVRLLSQLSVNGLTGGV